MAEKAEEIQAFDSQIEVTHERQGNGIVRLHDQAVGGPTVSEAVLATKKQKESSGLRNAQAKTGTAVRPKRQSSSKQPLEEQHPRCVKDANPTVRLQHDASAAVVAADAVTATESEDRAIFENGRNYVKPGSFFQFLTLLYSERKLVLVVLVHFVATMVIWANFFLIKFEEQKNKVPEGANRYWLKRLAPPLEFGTMHAILFQMALLPLTMSRLSIAWASNTVLNRFFPFNRSQRIHIHLGYTWVTFVILSTAFFFAFFGILCSDGEQDFCDKFKSEIMITGYLIVATCLVIGASSYFRDKIPYEVFYGIHHVVFIMYLVVILHTIDRAVRKDGQTRSQTFKWFSATLLYYFSDRLAMNMIHRYKTRVSAWRVVESNNGSTMILLQLHRPSLFRFEPGQYAQLKFPGIDVNWHPFSIGSDPGSDVLEFYIEVYNDKSWTGKLRTLLESYDESSKLCLRSALKQGRHGGDIRVEVMGPYGTSLGQTKNYSHAIAIGSGSGIVPVVSLYKKHVRQLLRLEPQTYFAEQREMHDRIHQMEKAKEKMRGSLLDSLMCCSVTTPTRDEMQSLSQSFHANKTLPTHGCKDVKDIQKAAKKASLPIYGVTFLILLATLGVTMMGLTLSWNELPFELYNGMVQVLQSGTIVFQLLFAAVAIGFWDRNSLFMYIDVIVVIVGGFADWYWFLFDMWGNFDAGQHVHYFLLHGYMTARLWNSAVKPRHVSSRNEVVRNGIVAMDKLCFIWVTRSATNVAKIAPDIIEQWDALVAAWGHAYARKACQVSFYITDKDEDACATLRTEVGGTSLYREGSFHFGRPNFQQILEEHALQRINDRARPTSTSLLAFCGSPSLVKVLSNAKNSVDISTMITGNKYHQMEYVSESYGAFHKNPKKATRSTKQRLASEQSIAALNETAEITLEADECQPS